MTSSTLERDGFVPKPESRSNLLKESKIQILGDFTQNHLVLVPLGRAERIAGCPIGAFRAVIGDAMGRTQIGDRTAQACDTIGILDRPCREAHRHRAGMGNPGRLVRAQPWRGIGGAGRERKRQERKSNGPNS
jgi:hypothetical protein